MLGSRGKLRGSCRWAWSRRPWLAPGAWFPGRVDEPVQWVAGPVLAVGDCVVWAPHALPAGCHCSAFPISLCCSSKHHVYLWSVPVCLNLSLHSRWRLLLQFSTLMRRSYIGPHFFCIHFRISLSFMMKKFSMGNVYICMILETPDNSDFISVYWHLPSCV